MLPKVTHILNRGAALREHGVDASNIDAINGSQVAKMQAGYAADQTAVMSLYADVHTLLRETLEKQAVATATFHRVLARSAQEAAESAALDYELPITVWVKSEAQEQAIAIEVAE